MSSNKKYTKTVSIEDNGVRTELTVKQLDVGWLLEIHKSWEDKKKGYQCETKRYAYEHNPFEKEKEGREKPPKLTGKEESELIKFFSVQFDLGKTFKI